ncbi:4-alpha-N-acetylgalactosaminyltransferase [Novipirellula aureliae]|uniref:4-alpha-N-acetylgalactosaminyltransferase n=1 Tax=Novipirellula aureliae TaxID=2527966 RepID=A0A5C6E9M8_9BACT|nr:glycosyltransferase [Novipirellula aureliae]TWU45294.1 4-alpha-N-acetylgalactosaminyltransferase [Novipirellula aureliae]
MSLRVLFMISSMRGGGSERQTLLILKHLDRSRFEPHLYLTERTGELLGSVPSDVPIHSFDQHQSPMGWYYPGRRLNQQVAHLRQLLQSNEIDVVYDRTFHMTLIAGKACRKLGVPRVSTIVSPPHQALPMVERRFVRFKRSRLAKAYKESRTVVAVSRVAAASAEHYYGLEPQSVKVVYNPVEVAEFPDTPSPFEGLASEKIRLLCVGRMSGEKGHADLIKAMSSIELHEPGLASMLSLTLVGDGPLRESLQVLARQSVPSDRIQFVGVDPNAEKWIAAADALILPSTFEGMPNVVLEAMALRTPVIATRAGGTVELERDEPTVEWAEPKDPESLARAIIQFAHHRNSSDQKVETAWRYVNEYHNVAKTIRKIESLLLGGDPHSAFRTENTFAKGNER